MSNSVDYRRFSTELPEISLWNQAHTNLVRSIVWNELDNDISAYSYNWVPEDQAAMFTTQKGTRYKFPLGVRLNASIRFRIYSPEFTALEERQQAEGFAFTERDYWYLLKWQRIGGGIWFYPHREWATRWPHDDRFKVHITNLTPDRPDGKMSRVECQLSVEGVYAVTSGYPEANLEQPDDF